MFRKKQKHDFMLDEKMAEMADEIMNGNEISDAMLDSEDQAYLALFKEMKTLGENYTEDQAMYRRIRKQLQVAWNKQDAPVKKLNWQKFAPVAAGFFALVLIVMGVAGWASPTASLAGAALSLHQWAPVMLVLGVAALIALIIFDRRKK